ncbi:MAG: alanine racemase [Cyanobacteria bacterium P01_G01_bin.38]
MDNSIVRNNISRFDGPSLLNAIWSRHLFVLLRTALSQAEAVVKSVDISLNTEVETLKALSDCAKAHNKPHQVIIMVELGDLQEGMLPCDLWQFIRQTLSLSHLKIVGIGCNLVCYGGVKPDNSNMGQLSKLVDILEKKFQMSLDIISGGNSANYEWYKSTQDVGRINNLRLGESILLGAKPWVERRYWAYTRSSL